MMNNIHFFTSFGQKKIRISINKAERVRVVAKIRC